jgi:hypothetical protein
MSERYSAPNVIDYENKIVKIDFIRKMDGSDKNGGNKIQFSLVNKDNGNIIETRIFTLSHPVISIRAIKRFNENEFIVYGERESNKLFYCVISYKGELITEKYMDTDLVNLGSIFSYIFDKDYNFVASYNDKKEGLICRYNLDFKIIDSLRIPFVIEDTAVTYPSIYLWVHSQTQDGGYLFSYRHGWPFENNYVFKTDKDLNIIRSFELKSILFPGYPVDKFLVRFIEEKDDGSYFVVMNNSANYSDSTFALLSLDSEGNVLLKNFYGGKTIYDLDKEEPRVSYMSAVDLQKDSRGNYLIGCSFRYPIVMKSDPTGNEIWQKIFNILDTNLKVGLVSILPIGDTTMALTVSDYGKFEDNFGNIYWKPINSYIYYVEDKTSNIDEESIYDNNIILIPNPNSGEFKVGLNNYSTQELFSIEVYDIIGNKVFSKDDVYGLVNINIRNKPSGVYLISVNVNNKVITKQIYKVD